MEAPKGLCRPLSGGIAPGVLLFFLLFVVGCRYCCIQACDGRAWLFLHWAGTFVVRQFPFSLFTQTHTNTHNCSHMHLECHSEARFHIPKVRSEMHGAGGMMLQLLQQNDVTPPVIIAPSDGAPGCARDRRRWKFNGLREGHVARSRWPLTSSGGSQGCAGGESPAG